MPGLCKRVKANNAKVQAGKTYNAKDALEIIKGLQAAKFIEGVDVAIRLGVDPRKSNEVVRGSVILPKGTGKKIRVAVFTSPANADVATKAGADLVGMEDLAESIKAGEMNFDMVIATPDAMRVVGQLGQVLGPRGLMPNPKDGTVTTDVAAAVKNAKAGQVRYRTDKGGIVHCSIGKLNFAVEDLIENLEAVLVALKKSKPSSAKGVYLKKLTVSSTMGPGLQLDISSLGI